MLCFLPFCMYLILFCVTCFVFFLPTMFQFSFVVLFFCYENWYFHGLVEYIWFFLVPHYSHHHLYFKSCCFDWKKNIWSKINTIIVQACLVFLRAEMTVEEGQYCFRAAGVRLPLWDLCLIHGVKETHKKSLLGGWFMRWRWRQPVGQLETTLSTIETAVSALF